ncbi:Pre-mRNA-splicing factor SYF1 [Amphibalanus amphitrite]|uniref:Pre-mRNA-splicing factor SYF1 n=1 Tax=Amphibalanus amphitrite TaxID=1232801 RepID=A0A6A4V9P0_AMPAM|nr:Pre-mRNA-splicing factor SYF1 [Amphibalanus amphitrite]
MPVAEPAPLLFGDDDLPYEEEILRNPYSVKHWLRYIEHKKEAPREAVNMLYERALRELPGSYKLWHSYLRLRRRQLKNRCITDPAFDDVNSAFERALVFMHKMPRIWLDYCQLLIDQQKITRTRRVFDRALRALPITQHHRLWPLYIEFVKRHDIPETAVRVFRRYLKLCPEKAAVRLAGIVNEEHFVSQQGKSNHQLWNELCELISKNPHKVTSLDVNAIIRGGLRRYTDQLGQLWSSLADYYIRSALFDRARDIYEEAIQTVTTVRDFTQVFDAYAQFEELSLNKRMEQVAAKATPSEEDDIELELRLARFEELIQRRPLLLNSVLLRQNPHNVLEWHKRVELFAGKPREIINTYTEAVQTVDPKLATGKLHTLWVAFAKFYEENDQLDDARVVFEKGCQVGYTRVDDLAAVWCEWAEMEIRHEEFERALQLMQRAVAPPPHKVAYHDQSEPVQMRVHKSLKLWSMYADLEESFGTFKTCKAVYDRIIELKIATPRIIINYGLFLEESNYFEEAFKAYEKGIGLFKWPYVYDIWNTYLTKFVGRYGGTKLERARDLFEQCLEHCPEQFAKALYMLYAKLEEEHGLARHAMAVYDRATAAVPQNEKKEMFDIYTRKAAEIYGVTRTREIYEKAIEQLRDDEARDMCMRFAELERRLGEIDRARAIYAHCSQMCDPRTTAQFWSTWREFEVAHGNEDTMREMLRIKRSVQATYNTQVNMMSAAMLASASSMSGTISDLAPGLNDGMRMLEARAAQKTADRPAAAAAAAAGAAVAEGGRVANPAEIQLDDDDDEEEGEGAEEEEEVAQQAVPAQVFGSLARKQEEQED